jgi:hypothetical protein
MMAWLENLTGWMPEHPTSGMRVVVILALVFAAMHFIHRVIPRLRR